MKVLATVGKFAVMVAMLGGVTAFMAGPMQGGVDRMIVDMNSSSCRADKVASGLETKMVGTECYYFANGHWVDIIELAANGDRGTMKPEFGSHLDQRAADEQKTKVPSTFLPLA